MLISICIWLATNAQKLMSAMPGDNECRARITYRRGSPGRRRHKQRSNEQDFAKGRRKAEHKQWDVLMYGSEVFEASKSILCWCWFLVWFGFVVVFTYDTYFVLVYK